MSIFLSLILALATLLSSFVSALLPGERESSAAPDAAPVMAERFEPPAPDAAEAETDAAPASVLDAIEYEHYDPAGFYEAADELKALADAGRAEDVIAQYDELYREFLYVDALDTYAYIRFYDDMSDDYWSDEYTYLDSLAPELSDAFEGACWYVLRSDCADSFAEHIGGDAAAYFSDYEPLTDEELGAALREVELLDEYYSLYDAIGETSVEYNGEAWTFDDFFSWRGDSLAQRDYDAYYNIFYDLQRAMSLDFAPVYIELVRQYTAEARSAGYDDPAEYLYTEVYGRDFTPADAQALCDEVKPIARDYYADMYYSGIAYAYDSVSPSLTAEEAITALREYLPRVDKSLLEPLDAMTEQGLYDIAAAGGSRYDGAFTIEIPYTGTPFIFSSVSGDCYDFITLSHEYGHFANAYLHPLEDVFSSTESLDLCEIHSNGLQALLTEFYGELFDAGEDAAEFANLSNLLENIIDGCVFDEFQRRVFADLDALTPKDINRIFTEVRSEYGVYGYADAPAWDADWVYVNHSFEQPMYYISYAASAMAALQIWDAAQEDFRTGVGIYLDILGRGAYEQGYCEVLQECGLRLFSEPGAAEAVCRPVLDRLEELELGYQG